VQQQFSFEATTPFTLVSEGPLGRSGVPTLSTWGVIIATAILLLMILWMHRRRMRQQQA